LVSLPRRDAKKECSDFITTKKKKKEKDKGVGVAGVIRGPVNRVLTTRLV